MKSLLSVCACLLIAACAGPSPLREVRYSATLHPQADASAIERRAMPVLFLYDMPDHGISQRAMLGEPIHNAAIAGLAETVRSAFAAAGFTVVPYTGDDVAAVVSIIVESREFHHLMPVRTRGSATAFNWGTWETTTAYGGSTTYVPTTDELGYSSLCLSLYERRGSDHMESWSGRAGRWGAHDEGKLAADLAVIFSHWGRAVPEYSVP